jgi:primosomal protein N' (replication factor Y)
LTSGRSSYSRIETVLSSAVTLVGSAKCPIERIKNRWRWHLMLKSGNAPQLTRVCRYVAERLPVPKAGQLRVVVDRDPVSLL